MMNRKLFVSSLASAIFGAAIMVSTVSPANAATLTYDFFLNTPLGAPMTDIVVYATDGVHEDVDILPDVLPGFGASQLTQDVDFNATQSFALGLSYAGLSTRTGLPRYHLMMFTNGGFAADRMTSGSTHMRMLCAA